jgi:spore germination protein KB
VKLSGSQLFWIVATVEVVMSIWLNITPTVQISKQDAWLSILVGSVIGIALTFFYARLSLLHPHRSLVEFSQALMGKWLGRFIVLPYIFVWYSVAAVGLRSFGDFTHLIVLDNTPVWLIMLLLIAVSIYLTYSSGITGIGRFSEITGPILFLTLMLSFILSIDNVRWHHLLPVYANSGWLNILKGSITPAARNAESFMLLVLVSFMDHPHKAPSRATIGVAISSLMVLLATIMAILIFGPNFSAKIRYPYFMVVRSIDILNFIQNVDLLVLFFWMFGMFLKISLYSFITSFEIAQLLNVKSWRKINWFVVAAIYIFALWMPNETVIYASFPLMWGFVMVPVCGIGIPILLWIVSLVRKGQLQKN